MYTFVNWTRVYIEDHTSSMLDFLDWLNLKVRRRFLVPYLCAYAGLGLCTLCVLAMHPWFHLGTFDIYSLFCQSKKKKKKKKKNPIVIKKHFLASTVAIGRFSFDVPHFVNVCASWDIYLSLAFLNILLQLVPIKKMSLLLKYLDSTMRCLDYIIIVVWLSIFDICCFDGTLVTAFFWWLSLVGMTVIAALFFRLTLGTWQCLHFKLIVPFFT